MYMIIFQPVLWGFTFIDLLELHYHVTMTTHAHVCAFYIMPNNSCTPLVDLFVFRLFELVHNM